MGRREELAYLSELMRGSGARGVVIAGAAGVGKTRLAVEALRQAEAVGFATAWATATRAASAIPFGAFAHLLPPIEGRGAPPFEVLRRVGDALVGTAGGARLALALDDAHLLDAASATLVHQLAASGKAAVIVTVRSDESAPDPIVALWKDEVTDYLELQALSQDDVERLVEEALAGEVEGRTLRRLWEATRGNVLFLRELVRQGLERESLVVADGIWRWRGPLRPASRLTQLIDSGLKDLEPHERELLELLAIGEPIDVEQLESLTTSEALPELQRRQLVVVAGEGRYVYARLVHPLYGDALRGKLTPLRARAITRRLADALEQSRRGRTTDVLRLATWRLDSAGVVEPELLLAAAARAEAVFDPALAERLARAAVAAGGGFAAQHAVAEALRVQGRFEEAAQLFAYLQETAPSDQERARVTWTNAQNLFFGLRRPPEAEAVIVSAARSLTDPASGDELRATHGWLLYFSGRPLEALAALGDLAERSGVGVLVGLRAALSAVPCLAISGQPEKAIALADRWQEQAGRLTDQLPLAAQQLQAARTLALSLAGRLIEAEFAAAEGYRVAVGEQPYEGTPVWPMIAGAVLLARGRLRTAARRLRESAAQFREFDPLGALSWPLVFLAQAAAQAGDAQSAATALAEAENAHWGGMAVFDCDLGLARAWTAAVRGEHSAARRLAWEAADTAERLGQYGFEVLALHELARLGDPVGAARRLKALLPSVEGQLGPVCAAHAAALAARDTAGLERAASSFEALGADLRAAEATSDLATAYRAEGRTASARAAATRARLIAARCEGARTPALAALPEADELTLREREVAALAAAGLSNRAIAERLVLSTRTVENHLQRVYEKLGATSRGELRALLELRAEYHGPAGGPN